MSRGAAKRKFTTAGPDRPDGRRLLPEVTLTSSTKSQGRTRRSKPSWPTKSTSSRSSPSFAKQVLLRERVGKIDGRSRLHGEVRRQGLQVRGVASEHERGPDGDRKKQLQKAARGQIKAACAVACVPLTPDEVKEFMQVLAVEDGVYRDRLGI